MALAKAVQNARHTAQRITWLDIDGDPENLSGATLTGRLLNQKTGVAAALDGVLALVTPAAGVFSWAYGVNDVGTAGNFRVQFVATFGDTLADKSFAEDWIVEAAL